MPLLSRYDLIFLPTHILHFSFLFNFVPIEQLQYNFDLSECQEEISSKSKLFY
nr:MAG TPA: hypothetical protein [Caudoviricetes sp.]